jgi:hypothetical protein
MAAALKRFSSSEWDGLKIEGLGHDLLTEWAPWMREDRESGASWHLKPRIDPGYHGDPPNRVLRVDKIVARIRLEHPAYYRVIARYYLDELQLWQMTEVMQHTEGWLRTMLLAACGLVEMRFTGGSDA